MKITQLMLSKGFGGAERYFVDLTLALAEAGHTVQAICHARFEKRHVLESHCGVEICTVNMYNLWDPFARLRIENSLRRFRPEIIQAHLARGATVASGPAQRLNIPLTVKTHNYIKLKYYRGVTGFITTTQDQKRYLIEHGLNKQLIDVIPNFSSLPPVVDTAAAFHNLPVFVTYGRMVKKKGFDLLLHAFSRLKQNGIDAQLVLGGNGPERVALLRLATQLALGDHVRFAGWIEDLASFLDQGDVFVLPSLDEPFGIVVLEAMAQAKPLIATLTQGPREILNDDTAYLVESGDVAKLAEAMTAACANPQESLAKAQRALAVFKAQYAKEAVIPRIEAHYRKLQRPPEMVC